MDVREPVASTLNRLLLPSAYGLVRRKVAGSQVAILAYHHVCPEMGAWSGQAVSARDFERQMKYLRRTSEIMDLDRLASCLRNGRPLPEKAVVITIDDGYRDNYRYAYPILKKYDIPATTFLTTGYIGSEKMFEWDALYHALKYTRLTAIQLEGLGQYSLRSEISRPQVAHKIWHKLTKLPGEKKAVLLRQLLDLSGVQIPPNIGEERILTWDEIKEMSRGGMSFGAHTVNHAVLTQVPLEIARSEILQSKRDVEERLDKPVIAFCYPNGDFNAELAGVVRDVGFACAVTGNISMIARGARTFELPRIPAGCSVDTLKVSFSGLYPDYAAVLSRITGKQGGYGTGRRVGGEQGSPLCAGTRQRQTTRSSNGVNRQNHPVSLATDESDKGFWEDTWQDIPLGKYHGIEKYMAINRKADRLYKRFLPRGKKKVLEIGCARGKDLIYFAREFGYDVWGVDYSEKGVALAQQNMKIAGVQGTILCEDIFQTSLEQESFDIVYSGGLIEHFADPEEIVNAHIRLLKKGGTLVIVVPNFRNSLSARLMKLTDKQKALLDRHNLNVMDKKVLHGLLDGKGIQVLSLDYFGPIDLSPAFAVFSLKPFLLLAHLVNQVVGYATYWMPPSSYFSPGLVLIGRKTE